MKRYELWQSGTEETGIEYSFFPEDNESARKLLNRNATLIWEVCANSWEEACTRKHEFLGWEPYSPNTEGYAIPAANIGDTDLVAIAQTNPAAAKEIARLEDLMNRGEETNEEFLLLCQLLFDAGSVAASEILLRRNLDYYEGHALYVRLFGTSRQEEFIAAIEAFKSQFYLELVLMAEKNFLVSIFRSDGGPSRFDDFALLSRPCEIKFGYIEQDKIEADVTLLDPGRTVFGADEWLLLFFSNGVWELADPMEA